MIKKFKHYHYISILLCLFTLIVGCQRESDKRLQFEYPAFVELKGGMSSLFNESDSMILKNSEYLSYSNGDLVIAPDYYHLNEPERGDVIYYETPASFLDKQPSINYPKKNIARIVGLPNERLEIRKGQIYINGKRLEEFYGKALTSGLYKNEFLDMIKKVPQSKCEEECLNSYKQIFDLNLTEILIPNETVFIIGDNWARSLDSRLFGSLPYDNIVGKVMGYQKP